MQHKSTIQLPRNREKRRNRRKIAFNPANMWRLLQLRHVHRGEQCVVLATGPSLKMADLSLLEGHPNVVGVNGVFKVQNSLRYYFVSCPSFFLSNEDRISEVDAEITFLSSHVPFSAAARRVYLKLYEKKFIYRQQKFRANLLRPLYGGPTVILDLVLPALIWMGFSEIILVGADYSLQNYQHFYPESEHRVVKAVDCENEMVLAHRSFEVLKCYIERHDNIPRIINASPQSDLSCFPEMSLAQALRPDKHAK